MARDITKGEVIYDYLQQESGNRELTVPKTALCKNITKPWKESGWFVTTAGKLSKKTPMKASPEPSSNAAANTAVNPAVV